MEEIRNLINELEEINSNALKELDKYAPIENHVQSAYYEGQAMGEYNISLLIIKRLEKIIGK